MKIKSLLTGIFCVLMMSELCAARYSGVVEAHLRFFSAEYNGLLMEINVARGQAVDPDTILFVVNQELQQSDVNEQKNELIKNKNTIEANIRLEKLREARFLRRKALKVNTYISQDEIDVINTELEQVRIRLAELTGELEVINTRITKAETIFGKQVVKTHDAGVVQDIYYRLGEYLIAGHPVVSVLVPEDVRVIFYVPHHMYAKTVLGQEVVVTDRTAGIRVPGKISFVAKEAVFNPPVMYSEDQWSRLVYEVEATVNDKEAVKLHPGQTVTIEVMDGGK